MYDGNMQVSCWKEENEKCRVFFAVSLYASILIFIWRSKSFLAVAAVAFGDMIIHCSRPSANDESRAFAKILTVGLDDTKFKFRGLVGLLGYGDDSGSANALTAKISSWAEQIFSGTVNADDWLEGGLNMVAEAAKENISNFELEFRQHFNSLLDVESLALKATKLTLSSKFKLVEKLKNLENDVDRAANGLGGIRGLLSKVIAVIEKVVLILKSFGSLDPSTMVRGWVKNMKTYIFGASDAILVAAAAAVADPGSGAEESKAQTAVDMGEVSRGASSLPGSIEEAAAIADPGSGAEESVVVDVVSHDVSSLLGCIAAVVEGAAFAGEKEVETYLDELRQKKKEQPQKESAAANEAADKRAVKETPQDETVKKRGSLRITLLHMALSETEDKDKLCKVAKDQAQADIESVLTILHTSLFLLKRGAKIPLLSKETQSKLSSMIEPMEEIQRFLESDLQTKLEGALDDICAILKHSSDDVLKVKSIQTVKGIDVLKTNSIQDVKGILQKKVQTLILQELKKFHESIREAASGLFDAIERDLEKGAAKVVQMLLSRETMKQVADAISAVSSQMEAASQLLVDAQDELIEVESFLTGTVAGKLSEARMVYANVLGDAKALPSKGGEYPAEMAAGAPAEDGDGESAESAEIKSKNFQKVLDELKGKVNLQKVLDELKGKIDGISKIATAVEHLMDTCPLKKAKEALRNALPQVPLKEIRGMMSSTVAELKSEAVDELRSLAEGASVDIDEFAGEASGILSEGIGILGDMLAEQRAKKEKWRAREVAVFVAQQVVASPNSEGAIRTALNEALTKRKVFEFQPEIKAILDADSTLPQQLNEFLYGRGGNDDEDEDEAERQERQKALWVEHEAAIVEDVTQKMENLDALRNKAEKETDVLKKQELLVQCRKEQVALQAASANISDVGKKLDVVIKFLDTMNSRLADMDGKLSAIQEGVTALHEDMKRLTGKPVLEVYEDWRKRQLDEARKLQKGVYIEPEVVGPGSDGKFEPSDELNPKSRISGKETSLFDIF